MAEDFVLKNVGKAMTDAVNRATNVEEMREAMKSELADRNVISRVNGDYVPNAPNVPPSPPVMPSTTVTRESRQCLRIVYPYQNIRCELSAPSEQELDAAEASLRAALSGR